MKAALAGAVLFAAMTTAVTAARAQAPALGLEVEFQGVKVVSAPDGGKARHLLHYSAVVAHNPQLAASVPGFHPGQDTYAFTFQLTLDGCSYVPGAPEVHGKKLADVCDMEMVTGPAEPEHWDDMRTALKCWDAVATEPWASRPGIAITGHDGKPVPGVFHPLAEFLTPYHQCLDAKLGGRAPTWYVSEIAIEGAHFAVVGEQALATHANFGVPLEVLARPEYLDTFKRDQGVPPQYARDVERVVEVWRRSQAAAADLLSRIEAKHRFAIGMSRPWRKAALKGLLTYWFVALGMDYTTKDVHVNMIRQRPHVVAAGLHRIFPAFAGVYQELDGLAYAVYAAHFPERIEEIEDKGTSTLDASVDKISGSVAEFQIRNSWLFVMSGEQLQLAANQFTHTGKPMTTLIDLYRGKLGGWPGVVVENRLGDLHLGFTPHGSTDELYVVMKQLLIGLGRQDRLTGS